MLLKMRQLMCNCQLCMVEDGLVHVVEDAASHLVGYAVAPVIEN